MFNYFRIKRQDTRIKINFKKSRCQLNAIVFNNYHFRLLILVS